jgi:hypothetical protein
MAGQRAKKRGFKRQVALILANADTYHDRFYDAYKDRIFGGPSLHFHRQALKALQSGLRAHALEYIYAVLPSWGMHRPGKGGAKMLSFEDFKDSITELRSEIRRARQLCFSSLREEDWQVLRDIFLEIKVMKTGVKLIGNSKVMAHLMPDTVPPVDREYTLKFLKGKKDVPSSPDEQWLLLRKIIESFFIPIASDAAFRKKANHWMKAKTKYPWDTSLFKVIDNLVIGAVMTKRPSA